MYFLEKFLLFYQMLWWMASIRAALCYNGHKLLGTAVRNPRHFDEMCCWRVLISCSQNEPFSNLEAGISDNEELLEKKTHPAW